MRIREHPLARLVAPALATLVVLGLVLARPWSGRAQPLADPSRFEFPVTQSFDAEYLGDTPGHIGRGGGLGKTVPHVALGDPVHRGETPVGVVTKIVWDRTKESLEVEFDPLALQTIRVGDVVWIRIGDRPLPPPTAAPR